MIDAAVPPAMRLISVAGGPFQRGRALGEALDAPIRAFLADGVARLEHVLGRRVDRRQLAGTIAAHAAMIERHTPELAEEIHGLAAGADVPLADAYLLQLRREIVGGPAGDCTTIATGGPTRVIAQTIDLPGRLSDAAVAVRGRSAAGCVLQVTFVGLLGYLGMNDRGLAVGISMVRAGGWRPGVPPYLIVRRLLELDSAAACVDEIARLPRASSRCYTIVDRTTAMQIETTCDAIHVARGDTLVHTNHFLSDALLPFDRSHIVHRRESRRRREHALAALARIARPALRPERLFDVLSAHGDAPICIHGTGDPRRAETVAGVVLDPAAGDLLVRRGPPCRGSLQRLTFEERPS